MSVQAVCRLSSAALLLALAAGCSKSADPAASTTAAAANGAITADTSNQACKLIPPEQVAEYVAAHDLFKGAPGLEPQFTKGQLFHDQDRISFKWEQASSQPLSVVIDLLRNCSQATVTDQVLREEPEGSGIVSATMFTGNHGSGYPAGTPAVARVTSTVVDSATMTGKTTVIGEYLVRLEGPKD